MSAPRNSLSPLHLGALCALLGATACSSSGGADPEDLRAQFQREMASERERHQEELDEAVKQREIAREEATARGREIERLTREREVARAASAAHKASLDEALAMLGKRDQELRSAKDTPRTVKEAATLLLAKDRQIKALREELARLHRGEPKPARPDLDGIVTRASLDLDTPVARVDGAPVTRRDFVEFLYRDLGAPQLLDLFVNRFLVVREARRRKLEIPEVDQQLWVTKQIFEQTREAGGEKKLDAELKKKGFSREAWEARLRYQALPSLLLHRMVELNRQTAQGKEAFEARVQAAYESRYTPRVRARHVVIACAKEASPDRHRIARRKCEAAYRQLKSGVDFGKVALHYSDDRESRKLEGRLGTFDRNKYAALQNLNTAFFTLPVGEVSPPIRSLAGYHLVLVEERLPPEKPFDERTRRALIERLEREPPAREEIDALVRKLRSRARIETALVFD